jgi:multisubunit Na+/H+ antiporter MnhG subunit
MFVFAGVLAALLSTVSYERLRATFADFAAPHISSTHKNIGVFLGSVMWFWVFYRAKQDGPALLVS